MTGTAGPSRKMWKIAEYGLNSSLFFLAAFSAQTQTNSKPSSPWFQNVHLVSNGSKSGSETSLPPLVSHFALESLVMWDLIVSKICIRPVATCASVCSWLHFLGWSTGSIHSPDFSFCFGVSLVFCFLCGWKFLMCFRAGMFLLSWVYDWSLTHCKLSYKVNYKW